jgi:hypothetical protein
MSTMTETLRATPSPGHGDWKESLGRLGLIGKGALYVIIGLLALQVATGDLGTDTSKSGAIEWVAHQPFGRFLLIALTVSLFAMAAWRLLDAFVGDPVEGDEVKDRVRFAVKGLLYLVFAVIALTTTISAWTEGEEAASSGSGGGEEQQATATVLDWPAGQWIVAIAGLALIGYALYMFKRHTIDEKFLERLDVGSSSWVAPVGRLGYAARSVVFVLMGWFLFQAGITYDPNESKGMSEALKELAGESWGTVALLVVAFGLVAYGLFNLAESRYRKAA